MKLKHLVLTIAVAGSVSLTFSNPQRTYAASWHSGTPSFAKGYWHNSQSGSRGTTYRIFKNKIWFRVSGWSYFPNHHRMRLPWHGYDYIKFKYDTSDVAILHFRNPQTGKWSYLELEKGKNKNRVNLYWAEHVQGLIASFHNEPEKLYRGVK